MRLIRARVARFLLVPLVHLHRVDDRIPHLLHRVDDIDKELFVCLQFLLAFHAWNLFLLRWVVLLKFFKLLLIILLLFLTVFDRPGKDIVSIFLLFFIGLLELFCFNVVIFLGQLGLDIAVLLHQVLHFVADVSHIVVEEYLIHVLFVLEIVLCQPAEVG